MRSPLLLLFLSLPAAALDLEITFPALERILGGQMFTVDGRRLVQGKADSKCHFGWLDQPRIAAENGRLRFETRFSGRNGVNFLGACVGPGDEFDVTITGIPYVKEGLITLKDIEVTSLKDGFYARKVREGLASGFAREFAYSLRTDMAKLLEAVPPGLPVKNELAHFEVGEIEVTGEAMKIRVEVRLVVK
ncbi:MAG: hypothetical protein K2X35_00405 [Bryobacteraceae bacterium]|nr:hypothetical protein [Bryobacteraceae bacterium]